MQRIDYYDDPDAPAANSLVPSANVVVVDDAGALLLIHRTDNDNWALPGGAMDLGESLVDTAVRETREETGIVCEVTRIGSTARRMSGVRSIATAAATASATASRKPATVSMIVGSA